MATLADTMAELERLGTEQNRKIYRRHGYDYKGAMFGVSFANLRAMAKSIRTDHALALELWDSENLDARNLAAMIADPKKATPEMLEHWVRTHDSHGLSDAIAAFAAKTPHARAKGEQWSQDPGELVSTAGWNLIGQLALRDISLPDSYFEPYLDQIQREIHSRPNRTRYAMNNVVIAIGTRSANLEGRAMAAAAAIGEVVVDHGETGCLTPDACAYIRKTVAKKGHLVKL